MPYSGWAAKLESKNIILSKLQDCRFLADEVRELFIVFFTFIFLTLTLILSYQLQFFAWLEKTFRNTISEFLVFLV